MLVALVALAGAALLNAHGLHRTAFTQPQGAARDVALVATDGLVAVSDFFQLSRPRQALADLFGEHDKDDIVTSVGIPDAAAARRKAAGPPPRTPFTPAHKLQLYTGGDSLAITPGLALGRAATQARAIAAAPADGQVATGLERPDVFNWFQHIQEVMRERNPNAVVLMFGGNDDKAYMTGLPSGVTINQFGSPSWEREYRRRVGGMMDLVTGRGRRFLVWIGAPIMWDPAFDARIQRLNAVYRSEAAKRPYRVAFVDAHRLFTAPGGGFSPSLDINGSSQLVRESDGVHLTMAGGDLLAAQVIRALQRRFDLESWKTRDHVSGN